MLGYTTRTQVENFAKRTFPEVATDEFNTYITAAESQINQITGYNARTTTSGMLSESIALEKHQGKVDSYGNIIVNVRHGPVHVDANNNPRVSLMRYSLGGVRVALNLTDGSNNAFNSLLELSENRNTVVYPGIYFMPAISTVTPTAKLNLYALQDVKFFLEISYVGGYSTVPGEVQLSANYLVADMLLYRDNPNFVTGFRQGSYSVEFGDRNGLLPNDKTIKLVNRLLQPYKRVTW